MNRPPRVSVGYRRNEDENRARQLAQTLSIPCSREGAELTLVCDGDRLSIVDARIRGSKPLAVEYRRSSPARRNPLARAIGHRTRTVVDATCGWGEDAFRLLEMAYEVLMIERNPVVAALLRNGLERAGNANQLLQTDAIAYFKDHPRQWDCVYLDPMFPPKRKAAILPKRALRLLRELVGEDEDSEQLFDAACIAAKRRVVVKRPDHVKPLVEGCDHSFTGKLVRYDVYLLTPGEP